MRPPLLPSRFTVSTHSAGFSLVELVIVCAIVSILAAIALASFANRDQAARFQADVASRIRERRASAIRINALTEATVLETFRQPPVSIDFSNLQTTAALVVEGEGDRTTFQPPATTGMREHGTLSTKDENFKYLLDGGSPTPLPNSPHYP